jgi:hypothetical protein
MKLEELEFETSFYLPAPTILHRVQRIRSRSGTVAIGPLRLAPRGQLRNRFDLPDDDVGYFAEGAETAVYETLARREATSLSISGEIALRQLLTLQATQRMRLLDLRPHANQLPVLQSLRFASTQALAIDARAVGYRGLIYRSAQRYGSDCFAIFGAEALSTLRLVGRARLVHADTGGLHRAVVDAIRGSKVVLTT